MRGRVGAVALVVVAALTGEAGPAHAQGSDPAVAAEDFFQRAKALMTTKEYAVACPLFAESYRLDPAGGTLQNLAVCYEELGKWASAYARFQELRTLSANAAHPRPDRVKLAEEHIAKLTPRLARVVIRMPSTRPEGLVVKLDEIPYGAPSWAAGIVVDPGPHVLLVSAPGREPFRKTLTIGKEGGDESVTVPPFASVSSPPGEGPDGARTQPTRPHDEPGASTLGWVVGGVGIASLAAGGVFGALALTANAAGRDKCSSATSPAASRDDFDPVTGRCYVDTPAWRDANEKKDEARAFANVANVLVPVGLVGIGVGAILVWRSSKPQTSERPSTARVVPSLGGAVLEGSF